MRLNRMGRNECVKLNDEFVFSKMQKLSDFKIPSIARKPAHSTTAASTSTAMASPTLTASLPGGAGLQDQLVGMLSRIQHEEYKHKTQVTELETRISDLTRRLQDSQIHLDSALGFNHQVKSKMDQGFDRLGDLERRLSDLAIQKTTLEKKLDEMNGGMDQVVAEKNALDSKVASLEKERCDLQNALEVSHKQLVDATSQGEAQVKAQTEVVNDLKAKLETAVTLIDKWSANAISEEEKMEAMKTSFDVSRREWHEKMGSLKAQVECSAQQLK